MQPYCSIPDLIGNLQPIGTVDNNLPDPPFTDPLLPDCICIPVTLVSNGCPSPLANLCPRTSTSVIAMSDTSTIRHTATDPSLYTIDPNPNFGRLKAGEDSATIKKSNVGCNCNCKCQSHRKETAICESESSPIDFGDEPIFFVASQNESVTATRSSAFDKIINNLETHFPQPNPDSNDQRCSICRTDADDANGMERFLCRCIPDLDKSDPVEIPSNDDMPLSFINNSGGPIGTHHQLPKSESTNSQLSEADSFASDSSGGTVIEVVGGRTLENNTECLNAERIWTSELNDFKSYDGKQGLVENAINSETSQSKLTVANTQPTICDSLEFCLSKECAYRNNSVDSHTQTEQDQNGNFPNEQSSSISKTKKLVIPEIPNFRNLQIHDPVLNVAQSKVPDAKISGDILRRAWISAHTQARSPRFHIILATTLAKYVFTKDELAQAGIRKGIVELDHNKILAIHQAVAKFLGWNLDGKDNDKISHDGVGCKMHEIDIAIEELCTDAKRKQDRLKLV